MANTEDGKSIWNFYPDSPLAGVSHIPLEEERIFSPEEFTFQFTGYKTGYGLNASLWKHNIDLSLFIAPSDRPRDIPPEQMDCVTDEDIVAHLPEDKRELVGRLRQKRDDLKAQLPPPADDALEEKYWQYVDYDQFFSAFRETFSIWNSREKTYSEKCREVLPPLARLYGCLKDIKLPDELVRDDTQFTVMLAKIMQFSDKIDNMARESGISVPEEIGLLTKLTDTLTDRMIEGGNRLYQIPRDMTQDELQSYSDMKLVALYSDKPVKERLPLLETLWDYSLSDLDDRISYLEKAIELVCQDAVHCPDEKLVYRHLATVSDSLSQLEMNGAAYWKKQIAEKLFSEHSQRYLADERFPQSAAALENTLRLVSVVANSRETAPSRIDLKLRLYLVDDSRALDAKQVEATIAGGLLAELLLVDQPNLFSNE